MKKRLKSMVLAGIMTSTIFSGCGQKMTDNSSNSFQDSKKNEKKFALLMSHMTNAFTMEMSGAVKAKADELGVSLTIFDGENDAAKQISQAEAAVTQGYSGIMIEPVSVDGIIPAIESAKKAGVTIVTVNQKISKQELADCYVGANPVQGGELEMEAAAKAIGGNGNVAFLLGPMGSDGQIGRTKGYEQVIGNRYPNIKVAYQQSANWKTDEALKLVENWIQTGVEIDAIVANNDAMALGALKAVQDAKLQDKIKVFGVDATPDALAAVKDGALTATISQSTTEQGIKAMEMCYKIVNGEKAPVETMVEHTLITKENVDKYIKR